MHVPVVLRLMARLRSYWWAVALAYLALLGSVAFTILVPWLVRAVIDRGIDLDANGVPHGVQHFHAEAAVGVAHRLGCVQRPAAREDGQPAEESLRSGREQVVAPGDGVAQGPLAGGQVARPAGEHGQPVVQPVAQRLRR